MSFSSGLCPSDTTARNAGATKMQRVPQNSVNFLQSFTSPCCDSCTICRPWSARSRSMLSRFRPFLTWTNFSAERRAQGLQTSARDPERRKTSTSCVGSSCTKGAVRTTGTMRHKCMTLSECCLPLYSESRSAHQAILDRLASWFQFNDESVTTIPSLVAKPKQAKENGQGANGKR